MMPKENKISELAPVIVFAYNRPRHLSQTLMALKNNFLADLSTLYIYIDGPKNGASHDAISKIEEVKKIAASEKWCKEVHILFSHENKGLAASIIEGVSSIISKHKKAIILEDDMITASSFLTFMNASLDIYENNENVISISGYVYPIKNLPETFFIRGADCWGWASWERAWKLFERNGEKLLEELYAKNLQNLFDYEGAHPFTNMLKDQIKGKNDSWAIRWYASAFLQNKLTLYPGKSLVQNIGFDGSGTHSGYEVNFHVSLTNQDIEVKLIESIESQECFKKFKKYFKDSQNIKQNPIRAFIIKGMSFVRNSIRFFRFKN